MAQELQLDDWGRGGVESGGFTMKNAGGT